jgi:hypothetical protein
VKEEEQKIKAENKKPMVRTKMRLLLLLWQNPPPNQR